MNLVSKRTPTPLFCRQSRLATDRRSTVLLLASTTQAVDLWTLLIATHGRRLAALFH